MSVSIEIVRLSESLDMYGELDASSAYSLSGHVSIAVSSTSSFFERRRAARFLLQSLVITFEGQSELIELRSGYTPLRLCSISRELAPAEPVELSNLGHEDSDEPCKWNVVSDLPIPGWLPASAVFGQDNEAGTRYSLTASAKFVSMDEHHISPWSFAAICAPFRSKTRFTRVKQDIILNRFMNPQPGNHPSTSNFPMLTYSVNAKPQYREADRKASHIPLDVIKNIRVLATAPEVVNVDDSSIPITLRLRTTNLDESQCSRLQLTDFEVDVEQAEKYRASSYSEYRSRFPVPAESAQPPNKPLLYPHQIGFIYEVGLYDPPAHTHITTSRTFSLVPRGESSRYSFPANNYVFAKDAEQTAHPAWYTVETSIPFSNSYSAKECDWAGMCKLRPSTAGPQFSVRHQLQVSLTCKYDIPGTNDVAVERLTFYIPIQFAHVRPAPTPTVSAPRVYSAVSPMPSCESSLLAGMLGSAPYALTLPAYSQLYDPNGDRKIDYSTPLPLYTPSSASSSPLELDAPLYTESKETDALLIDDAPCDS